MTSVNQDFAPLAARMRPVTIEQYSGQEHLLGEGKPHVKCRGGSCHSMILWGLPAPVKLPLLNSLLNTPTYLYAASLLGKDIRAAMDTAEENARYNQRTCCLLMKYTDSTKVSRTRFFHLLSLALLPLAQRQRILVRIK